MHWYIKGCVVDDIIDRANYICSAARQITAVFITRWVERGVKYFIRFHDFTIFRGGGTSFLAYCGYYDYT